MTPINDKIQQLLQQLPFVTGDDSAKLLLSLAHLYKKDNQVDEVWACTQEALQKGEDPILSARALENLTYVHFRRYEYKEAISIHQETIDMLTQLRKDPSFEKKPTERKKSVLLWLNRNYNGIALNYLRLKHYTKALDWYSKAAQLAEERGDKNSQIFIASKISLTYQHSGFYDKALTYSMKAVKLLESVENMNVDLQKQLVSAYISIGVIHSLQQSNELCRHYGTLALAICTSIRYEKGEGLALQMIGNAHISDENYKQGLMVLKKAVQKLETSDSPLDLANAYSDAAEAYILNNCFDKALDCIEAYQKINKVSSYPNLTMDAHYQLAKIYLHKNELSSALTEVLEGIRLAEKVREKNFFLAILTLAAAICRKMGKFEQACQYLDKYIQTKNEVFNEEKTRSIANMQTKYETEKKEQEIHRQKQAAEINRLQSVEYQLKALRAQINPHFIFNALNAIQSFISQNNPTEATRFLARFARLMRKTLIHSDEKYVPLEDEITFLSDFLALEQARFQGHFDFTVTFDEDIDEEYTQIPPMILQPYIENAILHGVRHLIDRKGHIAIHFSEVDDDYLLCTITDNGIGRQQAAKMKTALQKQQHKSMGTAITQQRLNTLQQETGQEIKVTYKDLKSDKGEATGTKVVILLPVNPV